jgi:hypothetical protein
MVAIFIHAISRLPWPEKRPAKCLWSAAWITRAAKFAHFTGVCKVRKNWFAWASKPLGRFTGSSVCSRSSATNFALGTPRRFAPAKCASRRPTSATPGSFSIFCSRSAFRKSGFPHPPNATSASCSSIATSWCACALCWVTSSTFWR